MVATIRVPSVTVFYNRNRGSLQEVAEYSKILFCLVFDRAIGNAVHTPRRHTDPIFRRTNCRYDVTGKQAKHVEETYPHVQPEQSQDWYPTHH